MILNTNNSLVDQLYTPTLLLVIAIVHPKVHIIPSEQLGRMKKMIT
jgi:hypothetical protein